MPRKVKKMTATGPVAALFHYLKESGTGEQKLNVIADCTTIKQAMRALEGHPGTHAKAVKWLDSDEAQGAAEYEARKAAATAQAEADRIAAKRAAKIATTSSPAVASKTENQASDTK